MYSLVHKRTDVWTSISLRHINSMIDHHINVWLWDIKVQLSVYQFIKIQIPETTLAFNWIAVLKLIKKKLTLACLPCHGLQFVKESSTDHWDLIDDKMVTFPPLLSYLRPWGQLYTLLQWGRTRTNTYKGITEGLEN